jgi:preprotein translocase subunit SecG
MLSLFINFLLAIHVVVSLLIIFIVLMQRPKSEGLGAAFGGGMTENLFGAQTSNVLANATRWLGGIFFFLTLVLSILYARQSMQHSSIQANLIKAAALATPAPSASPASGAAALTGTSALSGTEAPFSGAAVKLGPGETPAPSLLPPPSLGATPAPAPSGDKNVELPVGRVIEGTATPSPAHSGTSGH